ncbi:MAG: hypothetical protein AB7P24_11940 [Nitrospira sp.]
MIILRTILFFATLSIAWLQTPLAQSATYYISPNGSDSNPGTSEKPWLTFAYAISSAKAWCGDTLVLKDGTYGDGTRTGKISLKKVLCTQGNELAITAQNQRKAKIVDNGTAVALMIDYSTYIIVDGLYLVSTNNPSVKTDRGRPSEILRSNHITLRNNVGKNPNKYANTHIFPVLYSQDILLEDNEGYDFHRHCTTGYETERMVVRRQYCNPRTGGIPGGVASVGQGDAVMSMYPCQDCILENSIADGPMYLNEMNATFGRGVLMNGAKVLGSICHACKKGNGIYLNARKTADLDHTPQNITIRDVAIVDFNSKSAGVRISDGVNITLDHITILGGGSGVTGVSADDTRFGSTPTTNSVSMTNILIAGMTGDGFRVTNYNTWRGERLFSHGNHTAFQPPLHSNWTNTSTKDHGLGNCKVWVPSDAAVKGAGMGGSDIGANILYRYVDGVLTKIPLWDPLTGAFPHGEADLDGTNRVTGESLFDVHKRLNVNTNGCQFPRDYGNGGSDTKEPGSPVGLKVS